MFVPVILPPIEYTTSNMEAIAARIETITKVEDPDEEKKNKAAGKKK